MLGQFTLLADYNIWMNDKVYAAASELSDAEFKKNCGAFFGSIHGTLNHLLVADRIWLQRFAHHFSTPPPLEWVSQLPHPTALDEMLFNDFQAMREHRQILDASIKDWVRSLSLSDLQQVLEYSSMKGISAKKPFAGVLLHFFNHQTHHRGQVTTLFSQLGKDVGATDFLLLVQNENE